MLEFAYLQDDMVSTIEFLMSAWCKENLNTLEDSRWWMETFNQLSNEGKEKFIQRYREQWELIYGQ